MAHCSRTVSGLCGLVGKKTVNGSKNADTRKQHWRRCVRSHCHLSPLKSSVATRRRICRSYLPLILEHTYPSFALRQPRSFTVHCKLSNHASDNTEAERELAPPAQQQQQPPPPPPPRELRADLLAWDFLAIWMHSLVRQTL